MGAIMNEKDVERILIDNWDPIGIADEPLAHDEYRPYVANLIALLKKSTPTEIIASKLLEIERAEMGLAGDSKRAHRVAALLNSGNTLIQ